MENSLKNKSKTHSLYTFTHMNPQDVKFQLFWVNLNKNHVFLALKHMDVPYLQIDINYMVLLLIIKLFYILKWCNM